jgi:hypothetical protein
MNYMLWNMYMGVARFFDSTTLRVISAQQPAYTTATQSSYFFVQKTTIGCSAVYAPRKLSVATCIFCKNEIKVQHPQIEQTVAIVTYLNPFFKNAVYARSI